MGNGNGSGHLLGMSTEDEIKAHIGTLAEPKRSDMIRLHGMAMEAFAGFRLWYFDGRNEQGKVVANPNIGYGAYTVAYADGSSREFFRVGISANTAGLSVYIMGLSDMTFLTRTYGQRLGKASITGYCIRFKCLKDIDPDVLMEAMRERMK